MTRNATILLLFALLFSCHSKKVTKPLVEYNDFSLIHFIKAKSLSPILDFAADVHKPVFLYLHTSWCIPCKFMETSVFDDPSTAAYINANFIAYEADMEIANGPDLKFIFNANEIPTLLILNDKGRELSRIKGSTGTVKFNQWAKSIVDQY